jgi:type I restriction enzyme, S subunit
MARDWVRLPSYSSKEEAEKYLPDGWRVFQIEQLYEQLPVGKRFEQKTSFPVGSVPVIDQSVAGIVGWHNEEPGVLASPENPVVTFANHTCEMRLMEESFSVIQNVFPLIGKNRVCQTRFLYYLTKGRVWLEEYKGHFPDFRRKWVCCPPVKEQEKLVKVFGDLDEKIDLNRRINQTLEAMAQAIFKSWFVDFDPVKAKIAAIQEGRDTLRAAMSAISGKPEAELDALPPEQYDQLAATAELFPDEMDASELGEIPRGWIVSDFGAVSNCFDRKRIPLSSREREKKKGSIPYYGATSVMDYVDEAIFDGVYLLLGEDGSVLKPDGTPFVQYIWGKSWVNNHAHVLQGANGISTEQLMLFISTQNISAYVTGAVQLKLNQKNMNSIPFIKAHNEINSKFAEVIAPLFAQYRSRIEELRSLTDLRDTLLPKLLSGELSVADVTSEVNA